jgi:imidazoleglycerol-phosphate dehydratase
MQARTATVKRDTLETQVSVELSLDGEGQCSIFTGIGFFDHMLTLLAVHGFFDLTITARGDLDVDFHHTMEDVGLALGNALNQALGKRQAINRYGHAITPMDETLTAVTIDLSNRPYLVYHVPGDLSGAGNNFTGLSKEFFRAFTNMSGMNLHINVFYGENEHHIIESIFKSAGRALAQAAAIHDRVKGVRSSKGAL